MSLHRRFAWAVVGLMMCAFALALATAGARAQAQTRDQLLKAAGEARAKGNYQQAIRLLSEVLSETGLANDRRAVILNDRAMYFARIGAYGKAFADFNASVQLFPENAALYNNRGAVLTSLGQFGEAVKDLDRAIKLAPGYATAYANRALAERALGRLGSTLLDLRLAVQLFDNKAAPLIRRAIINLELKRPNAAMRDLDRALLVDARNALGYRLRAQARLALGEDDPALEDLSRAIAFAPGDIKAYLMRGKTYLARGDFAEAVKDFSKVIELNANLAEGWQQRGHANILINDLEAAQADLSRALTLAPRAAATYAYRALLFKKMAQPELGQREIQAGEQIDPENPVVLWARGEILEAVGSLDAAADSYRAALERAPRLKPARLGLARLGKSEAQTEQVVPKAGKLGWEVVTTGQGYYARSAQFPGVTIPLEPFGGGAPSVVSWSKMSASDGKGEIGILTVLVGAVATRDDEKVPLATAAVIDLTKSRLLVTAPSRIGEVKAEVTLQNDLVVVRAADGLEDRISLVARPNAVAAAAPTAPRARRSPHARRSSNNVPHWAPWAEERRQYRRRSARRTYRRRSRRRRAKSLFDLFLGN